MRVRIKLAVSPIKNWVALTPGVPKRLHFYDHRIGKRVIRDPTTGKQVERETLLFSVDREDGVKVEKVYSIKSQKLAGEFAEYLSGARYKGYEFTVVKDAPGPVSPRIVTATPI